MYECINIYITYSQKLFFVFSLNIYSIKNVLSDMCSLFYLMYTIFCIIIH